jgi:hypothetical protein
MIEDMQVRNLAPHTLSTYLKEITRFARYFGKSPEPVGEKELRTYQLYLTNQKKVGPELDRHHDRCAFSTSVLGPCGAVLLRSIVPVSLV